MSFSDFIQKELRITRDQGATTALKQGIGEATMKASYPYARWRSTPIWQATWDVCLVLDSCRYDLFRETLDTTNYLDGQGHLDAEWSVGSCSPEWISHTFADRHREHWQDAGYVTANPFSGKQGDEIDVLDPDVYPLNDRGLAYLDEVWRDQWPDEPELPTIRPEVVTERALWAYQHRDVERIVVHYMQPHIPFRSQPEWCPGWDLYGFGTGGGKGDKDDWHKVRDGEIPEDAFWNAYRDNLEWVLKEVERWLQVTDADILVTSDHGNAMGEWQQWGHPPNSANPAIRRVPWLHATGTNTADYDPNPAGDPPVAASEQRVPEDELNEQLEALGYV